MPLNLGTKTRILFIEIAWLLGSWAFSWLLLGRLLGYGYLWGGPLHFQLHSTYFVVSVWIATILLFLVLATLVTGIRVLVQALQCFGTNAVLVALASTWSLTALLAVAGWLLR